MVFTNGLFLVGISIIDILNRAADQGVFSHVLPFLIVFALIYGILESKKILGENKGVHILIAVALGLLSLVGGAVPAFFQDMAPKLGVSLMILLAAMILLGLFYNEDKKKGAPWIKFIWIGIGVIAIVVSAYSALTNYNIGGAWLWQEYGPALIVIIILGIIIGLAVNEPESKGG